LTFVHGIDGFIVQTDWVQAKAVEQLDIRWVHWASSSRRLNPLSAGLAITLYLMKPTPSWPVNRPLKAIAGGLSAT
jgi:hypothetical protein